MDNNYVYRESDPQRNNNNNYIGINNQLHCSNSTPIISVNDNYISNTTNNNNTVQSSLPIYTRPRSDFSRLNLNVGGTHYEITCRNLMRLPKSRLALIANAHCKYSGAAWHLCDIYLVGTKEYYFDRSSKIFDSIIEFYRTGQLHFYRSVCPVSYYNELQYWGIDEYLIEPCCQMKYIKQMENAMEQFKVDHSITSLEPIEKFIGCWPDSRRFLWNLMENPNSSLASKIVAILSVFFIALSLVNLTISTLPGVRMHQTNMSPIPQCSDMENHSSSLSPSLQSNDTDKNESSSNQSLQNKDHHIMSYHQEPMVIFIIECCCMAWFTLEYIIRLLSSPNKLAFVKGILNTIDLVAILPFYLTLIIEITYLKETYRLSSMRRLLPTFRVLRIMRILKLARHSVGLQSLGFTLRQCYKELSMLGIFLMTTILLFSSLIYFAEKDVTSGKFKSIPHSFWWAAITITTVGYGDMYPESLLGKIIGTFCCICGVIVIALPIPIIVNNFACYYNLQLMRNKSLELKLKTNDDTIPNNIGVIAKTSCTLKQTSKFTNVLRASV